MPTSLAHEIVAAAGGTNWEAADRIEANRHLGGGIWGLKRIAGIAENGKVTVDVHRQHATIDRFGSEDMHADYTPGRVELQGRNGIVESSLDHPRASFAGHVLDTPWTPHQLAYFIGYTMWTYTTEAWSLTLPGVKTEEVGNWTESGQTLRRLRVTYPASVTTHSSVQTFYADSDGLIRRRDYEADVIGGARSTQLISGHTELAGLVIPTRRDVYPRDESDRALPSPLLVSIRLTDLDVA